MSNSCRLGIGGMAAGVLMAHQGKKVLMVEKHDCLGGRVSAYKKGEFNFDLGVHIISRGNKGPLGEVLRRVGAENNLEYTNVRPLSSYDGKTFIFPHDLATMVPEEDFLGVKQFLKDIRSYTDEEVAQFDTVTVKDVLHKYTKNPACMLMHLDGLRSLHLPALLGSKRRRIYALPALGIRRKSFGLSRRRLPGYHRYIQQGIHKARR